MRSSIRRTWRSVTFNRLAAATCVRCFCFTSCNTFNRSRSRWLKAMRSVSMGPSANHESGHFYFAQTGHSHFAATEASRYLGVSPQTVYLWVERKQIPHLRVMGRNIRFLKTDLETFRASFKQEMENA